MDMHEEWALCKHWRVEDMKLTRDQLALLTGFSASMIKDYERPGRTIDENARKRYRLACAAVQYGISFDWKNASLTIAWPMEMKPVRRSDDQNI